MVNVIIGKIASNDWSLSHIRSITITACRLICFSEILEYGMMMFAESGNGFLVTMFQCSGERVEFVHILSTRHSVGQTEKCIELVNLNFTFFAKLISFGL